MVHSVVCACYSWCVVATIDASAISQSTFSVASRRSNAPVASAFLRAVLIASALCLLVAGCAGAPHKGSEDFGFLEVTCDPSDAAIVVDGEHRGLIALWKGGVVPMEPGSRRVEIVRPGYYTYAFDLEVESGRLKRLTRDLIRRIEELDDLDGAPTPDGSLGLSP